jgi:hypothetical protein
MTYIRTVTFYFKTNILICTHLMTLNIDGWKFTFTLVYPLQPITCIYIYVWFFCLHICLHYIFHVKICDSVACSLVSSPWRTIFKFSRYYIIILCNLPSWQTWSHIYIPRIESTRRALPEKKPQFIYKHATTQTPIKTKQNTTSHTTRQRTLRHTPPGSYNRWSG